MSTIYFTKALTATFGATSLFVPFAVYTIASYGLSACRAIIQDAQLRTDEHNRVAALYKAYNEQLSDQRVRMEEQFDKYIQAKRQSFSMLLDSIDRNLFIHEDYDTAIHAINNFSTEFGLSLKHINFDDFDKAMLSDKELVL